MTMKGFAVFWNIKDITKNILLLLEIKINMVILKNSVSILLKSLVVYIKMCLAIYERIWICGICTIYPSPCH